MLLRAGSAKNLLVANMPQQKQMLRFVQHDKREGRFVYVFVRHFASGGRHGSDGSDLQFVERRLHLRQQVL